jgi:hypothetical protein
MYISPGWMLSISAHLAAIFVVADNHLHLLARLI